MKLFEKDGITFEVHSVQEEARLKKAGYKETKPVEKKPKGKKEDKTPAEMNKKAVEEANKEGGE